MQRKDGLAKILAIVGILLIVASVAIGLVNRALDRSLAERLTSLEAQAGQTADRLIEAQETYGQNHLAYANHWSSGFEPALASCEANLEATLGYLEDARNMLETGPRHEARNLAERAADSLASCQVVTDILGPVGQPDQGLYAALARKAEAAETQVDAANLEIQSTHTSLEEKLAEDWNSRHGLTFSGAFAELSRAESSLAQAEQTLKRVIERGLIDRPLAYDQAQQAQSQAQQALSLAESDERNARAAWQRIGEAGSKIVSAQTYILASDFQRELALSALEGASSTLRLAEQAFWNQEFELALRQADQAWQQAEAARLTAATPTPTPTPTNTPEPTDTPEPNPIIIDGDDESDGVWDSDPLDEGSDDSVWDDDSLDEGTDDSAWGDDPLDEGSDDSVWDDEDW